MMQGWSPSMKVLGMDWSKRHGESEVSCNLDDFVDNATVDSSRFVVVHGAGSFGHFQASKSGVHKGGLDQSLVKSGFVATRISITSADLAAVAKAIDSGFIPVLHGDAVLDELQTDVLGVYDRPQIEPNAVLLREIDVGKDGKWSVVKPVPQNMDKQGVKTTAAAHDTTGVIKIMLDASSHKPRIKSLSGELRDERQHS
nr:hypothetical protein CFP56_26645 [Quercus suber]